MDINKKIKTELDIGLKCLIVMTFPINIATLEIIFWDNGHS